MNAILDELDQAQRLLTATAALMRKEVERLQRIETLLIDFSKPKPIQQKRKRQTAAKTKRAHK
jgi:hypothetical protein